MAFTNFPDGVTSLGTPVVGGGLGIVPNNRGYWFVSSLVGSSGGDGSYGSPFASVTSAISAGATNDIVVMLPGHAETVSAAGGITASKAGMQFIGMGTGTQRPTFTFATSTAATWIVSGAGVTISNIIGTASVDQIVSPFVVSGAGVTLNIEWQDQDATHEAVRAILTTAAADRLRVNLKYIGFIAGTHVVNAIRLVGCDNAIINADFYGVASTAWVEFVTTACTNVEVYGYMYNSGTTSGAKNVVDTVTGSTWFASLTDGAAGATFSGGSAAALASDDVTSVIAQQESTALSATAVMVNGNTIFTVAGGPIKIEALVSECVTANDGTASTVQYSITPTVGSAQTISGASGSIASAAAGASITLAGTALATAALYNANGPNLIANPGTIYCPAGTIKVVIGVGSTTGTWRHRIRYKPLASGVTVT